jgi:hypothetical protein
MTRHLLPLTLLLLLLLCILCCSSTCPPAPLRPEQVTAGCSTPSPWLTCDCPVAMPRHLLPLTLLLLLLLLLPLSVLAAAA